jgi:hypothetical protein
MNENPEYKDSIKTPYNKMQKFKEYNEFREPSFSDKFRIRERLFTFLHFVIGFYIGNNFDQLKSNWELIALAVVSSLYAQKLWK